MAELADSPNLLERSLRELEAFGLSRPASALVSEYLAVLVAEELIDTVAGEQIGTAYDRLRYGAVERNDPDLVEAVAYLEEARAKLASLPDETRRQMVGRIQVRLQPYGNDQQWALTEAQTRSAASDLAGESFPIATLASDNPVSQSAGKPGQFSERIAIVVPAGKQGWGARLRSMPTELAVVSAVVLFLAGYFSRHAVDRMIKADFAGRESDAVESTPTKIWGDNYLWVSNLRGRAWWEAANNHDRAAQKAYELLLLHTPRDAEILNNLAWLYLSSPYRDVRDSKRGLELAQRALKLNRSAQVLDTAAEGHFQAGNAAEAVKLEQEAIDRAQQYDGNRSLNFQHHLNAQLAKFQKADPSISSDSKPPSVSPISPKRSGKVGVL